MTIGATRGREELEQAFTKINQACSFDGAHLELSSEDRKDGLAAFLAVHYFTDEPLSKALALADDFKEFDFIKKFMLADTLSVLLVSDSTDEIIGAQVMTTIKKTDESTLDKLINEKVKTVLTFFYHKDDTMDVFRHYGVDSAVYFMELGVHRGFRKRGYASKLMQAAIAFSKELGGDHACIRSEGTSNFSKRIFEKNGFETLHETMHDEYKINGEVVFKNTGENKSTKIYVTQL